MSVSSANYRGVYTALVTPFRNGKVDDTALTRLLEDQIAAGVDGVIPVGTTGESPTLSMEEHLYVIELTARVVKHRTKVFGGTGSNSTSEALYLSHQAEKLGVDGLLVVSPYYNKPSAAGIFAHYSALAQATPLPIIAYSVPGRTGSDIPVETMAALAREHINIVAIKEAGGSIERFSQLRQVLPDHVSILSGDDSMTLPALAVGACGVISVASNLIPREVGALVRTFLQGHAREAEQLHRKFYPLFRDLFVESNPVPVKTALARHGWMTSEVRLPLVALQTQSLARLENTLKEFGLHGKG
jgi:4-hydroxy-tetrahydrodipicolinate synthase